MKTWQLILVQLWVLCFVPVWVFILIFALLVLSPPNPSWLAFSLFGVPPFVAIVGSIALWIAWSKNNIRWQKNMTIMLILFPIISTIPLFLWE